MAKTIKYLKCFFKTKMKKAKKKKIRQFWFKPSYKIGMNTQQQPSPHKLISEKQRKEVKPKLLFIVKHIFDKYNRNLRSKEKLKLLSEASNPADGEG